MTVTAPTANLLCTVLCDTCRSQPLTDKGKQVLDDIGYGSFLGCALRKTDALLAALKGYLRKDGIVTLEVRHGGMQAA